MASTFAQRVRTLYENATTQQTEAKALLTEMGISVSGERTRNPRGRRASSNTASASNSQAPTEAKVKMSSLPGILAERYPQGATFEQIRQILGWKPTAPSASFEKALVKTGRVVQEGNIYRVAA